MKKILLFVFALALAVNCPALTKNVTSASATASTLVTISIQCRTLVIQNTGSGDVNISIDGGTVLGLTDPTATTGQLLKAGTFVIFTYPGSPYIPPPIRVILTTATTTTIRVVTDDGKST